MRLTLCKIRTNTLGNYVKDCPGTMRNFGIFWWLYYEGVIFSKKEYSHKWLFKSNRVLHICGLRFAWHEGVDLDDPTFKLAHWKFTNDKITRR
jgi:hypothetical protein